MIFFLRAIKYRGSQWVSLRQCKSNKLEAVLPLNIKNAISNLHLPCLCPLLSLAKFVSDITFSIFCCRNTLHCLKNVSIYHFFKKNCDILVWRWLESEMFSHIQKIFEILRIYMYSKDIFCYFGEVLSPMLLKKFLWWEHNLFYSLTRPALKHLDKCVY